MSPSGGGGAVDSWEFEFKRMRAVVLLALGLAATTVASESRSGAGCKGWEQLNLVATTLDGTKVYYEKALEPNLPAVERGLVRLRESRAKSAALLERRPEIIADINRTVGVTDPNLERQGKLFREIAGVYAPMKLAFYVARGDTVKAFLRSGGQLPDCTYDRQADTADYNPRFATRRGEKVPETWDFALPVPAGRPVDEFVSSTCEMLGHLFGDYMMGTALHEVIEMTLIERMRPTDPYFRWFSDGFANAITLVLMEKYVGAEAAQRWSAGNDPSRYSSLQQELNLGYWMAADSCIHFERMPVQAEAQVEYARYAFSLFEARALIDKHGLDCVRQIVDAFRTKEMRKGSDLLDAIAATTGEDMKARLARYQTFGTREEGLAKYDRHVNFDAPLSEKECETAFGNVLRLMEVRGERYSSNHLQNTMTAALLLAKMGHGEIADGTMRECLERYSQGTDKNDRYAALEVFTIYALGSNRPSVAQKAADEILAKAPDNVSALLVKTYTAREAGNKAQAEEYAQQVLRLTKPASPAHRAVAQLLGLDPNAPADRTPPAGPR
jgi:hypothetical protein